MFRSNRKFINLLYLYIDTIGQQTEHFHLISFLIFNHLNMVAPQKVNLLYGGGGPCYRKLTLKLKNIE